MKKTDNKEMLNAIREQASAEYQEKIPMVDGVTIQPRTVFTAMTDYPTIKNEFIQTLINKVVKTDFFSRVYTNPLKELKKGAMPHGASIEELFVMAADSKGFFGANEDGLRPGTNSFDTANHTGLTMDDSATGLLGVKKADIKKLYVTLNFAHFFKTSISDSQLAHAFTSANGLSELVNQITSSLVNGAEQKEYNDMIELLNAVAQQKQLHTDGYGKIIPITSSDETHTAIPQGKETETGGAISITSDLTAGKKKATVGVVQTIYKVDVDSFAMGEANVNEGQRMAMAVRSLAGRLKFVSDRYNMAGVPTFTNPEDLVLLTTPEMVAQMDVTVIAQAFNVSSTDIKTKIILVDRLPNAWHTGRVMNNHKMYDGVGYYTESLTTGKSQVIKSLDSSNDEKCLGILMDKNFIQAYDTVNEARQFENGRSLMTNLFLHRQGMLANCYFANCIALFNANGYTKVKPRTHDGATPNTDPIK